VREELTRARRTLADGDRHDQEIGRQAANQITELVASLLMRSAIRSLFYADERSLFESDCPALA
jgi:hypothetical protein